ncbi:hypothetical protein Pst134EB_010625 [Puccinia striiformis f. sp. tritici]|nr:hypothetical protein Pst134EB_010625 [Puccinia striiformis f. sp. tritici]
MQVNICAFLGFMLALVGLRAAEELFFVILSLAIGPGDFALIKSSRQVSFLNLINLQVISKKAKHYPRRNSLFFKCDKGFDSYCCSKVTDSNVHRGIPLSPYDLEVKCGQQCLPPPQ